MAVSKKQDEIVGFLEEQQAAVIGHAIKDEQVWNTLQQLGLNEKWFFQVNHLSELWTRLQNFYNTYHRVPSTLAEFSDSNEDPLIKKSMDRALSFCNQCKLKFSWDVLKIKLHLWAKTKLTEDVIQIAASKFNDAQFEDAHKAIVASAEKINEIDIVFGQERDQFKSSAERTYTEAVSRKEEAQKSLPYCVNYLNDALLGILPGEVILVGGGTGAGKTQVAKILATHIAKIGKRVHYIALEAKEDEIERRNKYSLMAHWYHKDHSNVPKGHISFSRFCHGKLDEAFAPYEQKANEEMVATLPTLFTRYKVKDDFGIEDLGRELLSIKGKTDLVVLDHIHFVDLEGRNENLEMSDLIKKIRTLSGSLNIPIICVAHMKKPEKIRGVTPLIPGIHDYHGSSNITKIALTAIVIAPARGLLTTDPRGVGSPTFFGIAKCRLDGSVIYHTAVCFFNFITGEYSPYYALGRLNATGTKWTPIKENFPTWVNPDNILTKVSEVGE